MNEERTADKGKPLTAVVVEAITEIIDPDSTDAIPGVEDERCQASRAQLKPQSGPQPPWPLLLLGTLCILIGGVVIPRVVSLLMGVGAVFTGQLSVYSIATRVLFVMLVACVVATVVMLVVMGVRLILNRRRGARLTAEGTIALLIADLTLSIMLYGMSFDLAAFALGGFVLVAMLTYIDPSLSEERELQRKLRDMNVRDDVESGKLGRDKSGKGYIRLDFFNLFWIFVLASFLGDMVETVYHVAVVDPGVYQDRAGLLFGPFSPIYGFGATLMTIALNRFHNAHIIVVFLVSAVIGGAFEYFASWFLQFAFGVCAWDYSGTFLSIGGRTNFMFMCFWGILGVLWVKLLLPVMLNIVNLIPWKWRYTITSVAAVLYIADGVMTLVALDCWYGRLAGKPADNALAQFCADYFNDEWMSERFQSMSIDPSNSTRAS